MKDDGSNAVLLKAPITREVTFVREQPTLVVWDDTADAGRGQRDSFALSFQVRSALVSGRRAVLTCAVCRMFKGVMKYASKFNVCRAARLHSLWVVGVGVGMYHHHRHLSCDGGVVSPACQHVNRSCASTCSETLEAQLSGLSLLQARWGG
jgi:hypothetical protein